jgi:hypothetical protein
VSVHMRCAPVFSVPAALVYVGTNPVSNVWVAGRQLLQDGRVLGVDEKLLIAKGNEWAAKISKK